MEKLKSFQISGELKNELTENGIANKTEKPVNVRPKKSQQLPFGVQKRRRRVVVVERPKEDYEDYHEVINMFRELAGDPKDWLTDAEIQELLGKIEQDLDKNKPNGRVENTNMNSGREM